MDILVMALEAVVLLAIIGFIVVVVFAQLRGTDDAKAVLEKRTSLRLSKLDEQEASFETEFDLLNAGSQMSSFSDVFARPYLPQEQYSAAVVYGHIERIDKPRKDNYFEAMLLDPGKACRVKLTLTFRAQDGLSAEQALQQIVDMDTAVYICGASRKDAYIKRFFTTFMHNEFLTAMGGKEND